jgi:cobalt/nickel transport system ATP-binding protein
LEIKAGLRIAFIGANGSGKSTLLKLLDGLYFPQSGCIEFDGTPLTEETLSQEPFAFEFRRRVGFLFQDADAQLFSPTVYDEICFGPLQMQWPRERVQQSAEEMLKLFQLGALRERQPHRLSIGEKKKVALASIMILNPEVLLLDEPTAALDPRTQSLLLETLHDWGPTNKTIITSTHDLTVLREISDEVYVMQEGRIVHHDVPERVLDNETLLHETNLIHVHTHRHREVEHAHPHTHDFHGHAHEE